MDFFDFFWNSAFFLIFPDYLFRLFHLIYIAFISRTMFAQANSNSQTHQYVLFYAVTKFP